MLWTCRENRSFRSIYIGIKKNWCNTNHFDTFDTQIESRCILAYLP
jgi:hypothetical protein